MTVEELAKEYAKSYIHVYEIINVFPHPMKGWVKLGNQVHRCINIDSKGKKNTYYATSNKGCFHAQFHKEVVEDWPDFWLRVTDPFKIKISGGGPTGYEQPSDEQIRQEIIKLYE